jgi:protein-disulfide isomerase
MMSKESKIMTALVAVFAGVLIAIFMLGNNNNPSNSDAAVPNADKLIRSDSHSTDTGAVKVVEFGDYQCPACENAYPITKQLMSEYQGRITFVFRNYPLVQVHKNAQEAAEAAEAASDQGKFWEMHDKLYDKQNEWASLADPTDKFVSYATELGLDAAKFKDAVVNKKFADRIAADVSDGNDVSIQGTPTFFIDGVRASGYDHDTLKGLIDKALASTTK